ncbi:MAG: serine/threonine protein phosphatase [Saprospirales bacterium]|nr:serine/threonine protein phosphatase [Saprospirales bacterium]
MRRFAITDIHGCLNTFQKLLDKIAFSLEDELYLLGDFIDRGPDSKGLIDYILDLQEAGYKVHCLRGNHDQMMLDAMLDTASHSFWLANGGKTTLKSFGVKHAHDVPKKYIDFLLNLHFYLEVDNYILVHAGLDFQFEDPFANKNALLWTRDWYAQIDHEWLGDRVILHGHTPLFHHEIEEQHSSLDTHHFLGLDNGCVYADSTYMRLGLGALCAFNLDDRTLTFVENNELKSGEPIKGPKSRLASIWAMLSF